jgi:hypothetical protein
MGSRDTVGIPRYPFLLMPYLRAFVAPPIARAMSKPLFNCAPIKFDCVPCYAISFCFSAPRTSNALSSASDYISELAARILCTGPRATHLDVRTMLPVAFLHKATTRKVRRSSARQALPAGAVARRRMFRRYRRKSPTQWTHSPAESWRFRRIGTLEALKLMISRGWTAGGKVRKTNWLAATTWFPAPIFES